MMKSAMQLAVVGFFSILGVAQTNSKPQPQTPQNPSATAKDNSTAPRKLERVHADLRGFELAPRPANTGTQIGGAARGMGTSTTLLAPHKGQAYTLNPLFQWANANGNIRKYVFRLLASDGNTVIFETSVAGTSLKYPVEAPALKPGGDYFWTVQPAIAMLGEASEPAEIVVVAPLQRAEIQSQLETYPEDSPQRAQFFVDKRLWYDSIESYTDLLKKDPENPEFLELRAELYEQLPQTKQSAEADLKNARIARDKDNH